MGDFGSRGWASTRGFPGGVQHCYKLRSLDGGACDGPRSGRRWRNGHNWSHTRTEECGLGNAQLREGEVSVHLCRASPCSVNPAGDDIHVARVRVWDGKDFSADYVGRAGIKILQEYAKKTKKPAPARERKSRRKPEEPASKPKPNAPKEKVRKEKAPKKPSEVVDVDEDERGRLREKLARVRRNIADHKDGGIRGSGGGRQSPRSDFAQEEKGLTSGVHLKRPLTTALALTDQAHVVTRGHTSRREKKNGKNRLDPGDQLLAQAEQQRMKVERERRKKKQDSKDSKVRKALMNLLQGRKKKKKRRRKKKKKRKRGTGDDEEEDPEDSDPEESSESESELTSSSSDLEKSEVSDELEMEAPLRRKALEKPGSVMRALVRQAASQMDRGAVLEQPELGEDDVVSGVRIASYFALMIRPFHQQSHPMVRELYSLAQVIDALRAGQLPQAADGLAARFISVHQALEDGHWGAASMLELYPLEGTSSASTATLLRAQKHRRLLQKSQGQHWGSGKGRGNWQGKGKGGWNQAEEAWKGDGKGKKGKKGGRKEESSNRIGTPKGRVRTSGRRTGRRRQRRSEARG